MVTQRDRFKEGIRLLLDKRQERTQHNWPKVWPHAEEYKRGKGLVTECAMAAGPPWSNEGETSAAIAWMFDRADDRAEWMPMMEGGGTPEQWFTSRAAAAGGIGKSGHLPGYCPPQKEPEKGEC